MLLESKRIIVTDGGIGVCSSRQYGKKPGSRKDRTPGD